MVATDDIARLIFQRKSTTPNEHALIHSPPAPPPQKKTTMSAHRFAAANSVSYVAPSLGAWLGYTSTTSAAAAAAAAATAATTGAASGVGSVGAFSAVSGAAGAGVAGYKMTRRTAGVSESVCGVFFVDGQLIHG